jgi:hypothetical protein
VPAADGGDDDVADAVPVRGVPDECDSEEAGGVTAKEWREKAAIAAEAEGVPLELPSGMTILARRPDPVQVAMWGQLPLSLAASVAENTGKNAGATQLTAEERMASITLARDMLVYCCVKPRIYTGKNACATEEEIHPREIPLADVMYLLRWARREEETEKLRPFRVRTADGGGDGGGEAVRLAAIGADGDRGPGGGAGVRPGGHGRGDAGRER